MTEPSQPSRPVTRDQPEAPPEAPASPGDRAGPGVPGEPGPGGSPLLPPGAEREVLRRLGVRVLALGIVGAVLSVLFFPIGLLISVLAVAAGVRIRRHARRTGVGRLPTVTAGMAFGVAGSVVAIVLIVMATVFWQEFTAYQECRSGANTITAQDRCWDQLMRSAERKLDLPPGTLD